MERIADAWFWFDALSYKAYLIPAKALKNFYPSAHEPMTKEVNKLRKTIGRKYYGESFCPLSGTVKKETNCHKDATVKIYEADLADTDIAFFAKANPNHEKGHGLLTFAPINRANIMKLLARAVSRKLLLQKQNKKRHTVQPQLS